MVFCKHATFLICGANISGAFMSLFFGVDSRVLKIFCLTVLDEEDNETLLIHNITSEDIYRKQEETIISWRDPEAATELALSFQEAAGCSYIWDNICDAQRNIQFSNIGDTVIEIFYEKHLDYLVDVPLSNEQCDRENPCLDSTEGEVFGCCRLAAVRFMRTTISRNDDFIIRHVVKLNLFKPIIDAFVENGDRYNMLQSGVLELLEYIRKEGLKQLIIYANKSFWDQLMKFEHFESIQVFRLKYQQYLESAETKLSASVPDMRKKAEERGLEKEEEDYFNEDSDEEDSGCRTKYFQNQDSRTKLANGSEADGVSSRSKSGGLVDYADDDDDDFNTPPKEPDRPTEDDEPLKISAVKRNIVNTVDCRQSDGEIHKKQ
ncbi:hypothetical protein ABZP36_026724 [Zizania latifolia]